MVLEWKRDLSLQRLDHIVETFEVFPINRSYFFDLYVACYVVLVEKADEARRVQSVTREADAGILQLPDAQHRSETMNAGKIQTAHVAGEILATDVSVVIGRKVCNL